MKLITSADSFFGTVKKDYVTYKEAGFFLRQDEEALFVYKIISSDKTHIGIIACNDISDIKNSKILKHENTLASKEQSMMRLMLQRQAMVKPVLLAYDHVEEIDTFNKKIIETKEPVFSVHFEETDEIHKVWKITDKSEIEKVTNLFSDHVDKAYIADGHHRCYTTLNMYKNKEMSDKKDTLRSLLVIYFPFENLQIFDFNRIVNLPKDISYLSFFAGISKYGKLKKLEHSRRPKKKFEIVLFLRGEWFALKWKKKVLASFNQQEILLDATVLYQTIMKEVIGIKDVKTDTRIKYIAGNTDIESVADTISDKDHKVAFFLYPVQYQELKSIANSGKTMPPKSTWFEPRIKNGVLVKEI